MSKTKTRLSEHFMEEWAQIFTGTDNISKSWLPPGWRVEFNLQSRIALLDLVCRQPVAFPHTFLYCSVMQFVCAVYLSLKGSWIWGPLLATHAPLVMAAFVSWGRSHESCVVQWNQTLKSWLSGWGSFGLVWDLQCELKNCTVVRCGEVVSVHFEVNSGACLFLMWAPFTPLTGSAPLTSLIPKISCGQLSSPSARHLLLCEHLIA